MSEKQSLSFEAIIKRFDDASLPEVDCVVGIQRGGRVIASLCAYRLKCPLFMLPIHFRDNANKPEHEMPVVFSNQYELPHCGSRILLVDDVSVTGKTMDVAMGLLSNMKYQVHTFVLKGNADIVLFPEIKSCVLWPWFSGS